MSHYFNKWELNYLRSMSSQKDKKFVIIIHDTFFPKNYKSRFRWSKWCNFDSEDVFLASVVSSVLCAVGHYKSVVWSAIFIIQNRHPLSYGGAGKKSWAPISCMHDRIHVKCKNNKKTGRHYSFLFNFVSLFERKKQICFFSTPLCTRRVGIE